jgi:hypothetical protein
MRKSEKCVGTNRDYQRGRDAGKTWAATANRVARDKLAELISRANRLGEPWLSQSIPKVFEVMAPLYPHEVGNLSFSVGFTVGVLLESEFLKAAEN